MSQYLKLHKSVYKIIKYLFPAQHETVNNKFLLRMEWKDSETARDGGTSQGGIRLGKVFYNIILWLM